jgi:hypothetical protein
MTDTLCGCGYRHQLHRGHPNDGETYCEMAARRHDTLTKGPENGNPNPLRSEAADPEATDEAGPKA